MTFSLSEIEAMGKRAARGAGLSWGLAEEAGKAARWLAEHDLPGPQHLADVLTRNDGCKYEDVAPDESRQHWQASIGRLCPLTTGAAICDLATEIAEGRDIELGSTDHPLLLAPYVAGAAKLTGTAIELTWAGARLVLASEETLIEGNTAAVNVPNADHVRCRRVETPKTNRPMKTEGQSVDAETWERLNTFAQRTFAPATDASRRAGAGAGLVDND